MKIHSNTKKKQKQKKAPENRRAGKTGNAGYYLGLLFRPLFRVFKILGVTLAVVFVLALAVGAVVGVTEIYPRYVEYKQMAVQVVADSDLDTFRLQESSYIYDSEGAIIAKLTKDEDSFYLPYDQIPEYAVQAFVAVEDRTFWENSGIDWKGIFRVGLRFLTTEGEEVHGASTITQQLARNRFLTREVSLVRKAKEMLISQELTKKYSKEQIMEFYINDISFANTYYGLEAASIGYFGKSSRELSLSQIAYLCAIPNSPSYYNPYRHPDNALKRRDKILDDMLEMGYITQEDHDRAVAETITIEKPDYGFHNYETTYAIDCAVRYLMELDGFEFQYGFRSNQAYKDYSERYDEAYAIAKEELYTGGYDIYTTLDPEKQDYLQNAIDEGLSFSDETAANGIYAFQGAATVVDNATGKVVAIVGGRSQETDVYGLNRAYQSDRQPGSSIKPIIVYAPALENGYTSSTIVKDVSIDAAKKAEKGDDLTKLPGGTMPLRQGVERSRNGVAWSVYADITPEVGMSYLTKMRFDNIVPDDYYLAASLGGFTHGVTTEEMAGAYAALANKGMYRDPTCIQSMKDKNGEEIYEDPKPIRVYEENAALVMVDILTGVVTRGTASGMGWRGDIEAAGKTGTTNNSKDGWFCGMTPYYTMTVWVGYDQPRALSSLWGSTYPAQIWKTAMSHYVEGLEPASFEEPGPETGTKKDVVVYTEPITTQAETPAVEETAPPAEVPTEPVTGIHGGPGIGLD